MSACIEDYVLSIEMLRSLIKGLDFAMRGSDARDVLVLPEGGHLTLCVIVPKETTDENMRFHGLLFRNFLIHVLHAREVNFEHVSQPKLVVVSHG